MEPLVINPEPNEVTGKREATGNAKLISMSDKVQQNSNRTNYKVATVEYITPKEGGAKPVRATALVYEGNYAHPEADFQEGQEYLITVSEGDERGTIARLSHLQGGGARVSNEAFGFGATAPATSEQEEIAGAQ